MNVPAHQIQGSDEWLAYRASRGNASECAALMYCSPFYPRNPAELFDVKTGRKEVFENEAMRRGSRLEEPARQYMENVLECSFSPHVCEHGRISASLDGIDFGGTVALELKVPVKGAESDTWKYVRDHDAPPTHYYMQVQQQLLCSGASECIFAVCAADESENIVNALYCTVAADKSAQDNIEQAWRWFFEQLDADQRPEEDKAEIVLREDDDWRRAAEDYRTAKQTLENAKAAEDQARKALMELAGERPSAGCGVKVNRIYVKGSIDYKAAIPEGIDLEPFRKEGRYQTRIDVEK